MDIGTVQSGKTLQSNLDGTSTTDNELLRRLVRLLSKSEGEMDELYAQDSRRHASASGYTMQRSKSEGFSPSLHTNRSRSVFRLAETAPLKVEPLRISRVPKVDLKETNRDFERSSARVRTKLTRVQNVFRGTPNGAIVSKAATKMVIHLENVTNYMKQQIDLLAQADTGPPSEVHARNLSSALTSLAQSARTLAQTLLDIRLDGLLIDGDDIEPLENLAQLAELESKTIKDSRANESLKRISGIHFRQHTSELSGQLRKLCDDISTCLSDIVKTVIPAVKDHKNRESYKHIFRTGIAVLFSAVASIMLSISVARDSSTLDVAVSGIWLISLACGIASGISGISGLLCAESTPHDLSQLPQRASKWLARCTEILFLLSAAFFSTGLCVFAFSSLQAVAARAVLLVLTSLHFLGLFSLLIWLSRGDPNNASRKDNTGSKGEPKRWTSMRNLAQLSIHPNVAEQESIRMKDVEQGLQRRGAVRNSAPARSKPIIRVTTTEDDISPPSAAPDGGRTQTNEHGADDSDAESERDLTSISFSHTHMNLAVPSAHRVSSDSSRSLPELPGDVQIVRCMSYSPNGMFLCIGNSSTTERCTIFSADSPAITLGELKLTDVARQIEWSSDGENILLRLSHTVYVWNAMPSASARRPLIIIHQDADSVKWIPNNDAFIACKKDILTSFDIHGNPVGVFQIPAATTQDFVVSKDGSRVICLISTTASSRSGLTALSSQKLILYNLESKFVEQTAPVGRDAQSIVRSTASPDLILVNFSGSTPPQVWRYRQNPDTSEHRTSSTFLTFKHAMSFKAPSGRFSGCGIFGSMDDKLILSLGEGGDMFVFASDNGQPLRHITTNASRVNLSDRRSTNGKEFQKKALPLSQCVAWDPDILSFAVCMGFADGSIWQWKIPFDAVSQNTSTFAVVVLSDEDRTLIRAGDVERSTPSIKEEA